MTTPPLDPVFDPLLAMPDKLASRPGVDVEMAREVFLEAATLLHNSLALDALDEHDKRAVVAGLCEDLVDPDPGAAIRARALAVQDDSGDLHDPLVVAGTYVFAAQTLQL